MYLFGSSSSSIASFATFTVGSTTWLYILGIASVALAILLSAPGRPRFPAPTTWAICLALAGLGVLALAADSPLTLIQFWAALDLAEAGLILARLENRTSSFQVPYAFTMRLGSIGLVILAFVLDDPGSAGAKFAGMQSPVTLALLPAAALLRLAAFAIPWPKDAGTGPDDVDSMIQLIAGAASVGFLSQLPPVMSSLPLLIPCALAALYAGWMFLRAADFEAGRPLWIMGIGSLAVAASLQGNPLGAAGWGCSILLVGSALCVNSIADRWARRTLLVVLLIISGLPFTLTATAWLAPENNWTWILPVFLAGQAMLLAGCYHLALRPPAGTAMRMEVLALRGMQYAGTGLPILVGVLLGLGGWPGGSQIGAPLAALLLIPLTAALAVAKGRMPLLNPVTADLLPKWLIQAATSMRREGSRIGESLQRLADAVTRTMEGEAGIMWGLLFLVLFVSLIAGGPR